MQQASCPEAEDWVVVSVSFRDQDELLEQAFADIRAVEVDKVDWEKTSLIDFYVQKVRLPFFQNFNVAEFEQPIPGHSTYSDPLIDYDRRLFDEFEAHVVRRFMDQKFELVMRKNLGKIFADFDSRLDRAFVDDHIDLVVCTQEMQAYKKVCEKKLRCIFYLSQILHFADKQVLGLEDLQQRDPNLPANLGTLTSQALTVHKSIPNFRYKKDVERTNEQKVEDICYGEFYFIIDVIGCAMIPAGPLFPAYLALSLGTMAAKQLFNVIWSSSQQIDPQLRLANSVMSIIESMKESLPEAINQIKETEESARYLSSRIEQGDYRSDITFSKTFVSLLKRF